jgi:DNA polymerase
MESLEEINKYWHKKNKCELKKTATQPVFGDGNRKAKIVFIGEAPGKEEDLSGKPFIGRAGKFLNEMLGIIKLNREDVYITNTVKYRPPENRDPKPEEIKECRQWLFDELNFIKPKVIVFLGRHSLNIFFPEEKISEAHGKVLNKKIEGLNTEKFLALYHPAAALYNGSMKETLIKDFKKIPKILEK